MRLVILSRVYCDYTEVSKEEPHRREQCDSYFDMELGVEALPLNCGNKVQIEFPPVLEVPPGWYVQSRLVRCSKHHLGKMSRGKEVPTREILERAEKLQALAMDKGATEGERANAWKAFGDLWEKYELPVGLGLEEI